MSDTKYGKLALIGDVIGTTGLTRAQVTAVVNATLDTIQRQVQAGQSVTLPGFGTFRTSERLARKGINPQTRQPMQIPARTAAIWKPSNGFMEAAPESAAYAQERAAGNRLEEQAEKRSKVG